MVSSNLSLFFRLIKPGANLHPLEAILIYGCAFWFAVVGSGAWGAAIGELAYWNALLQLSLFVVVVQIPCFITGKMSNVDLAWPTGLVCLALQVLRHHFENCSDDDDAEDNPNCYHRRSFLVGLVILVHGARMAVGAAYLFFPYDWSNGDLSRYQYAKKRWILETNQADLWWLKQQQETVMQAFANSVLISCPVIMVATNSNQIDVLRPLERFGLIMWLIFWILENVADGQMIRFKRKLRRSKDSNINVVLGYAPYNGWEFCLWTISRHPNYFCEWMCWNSMIVVAIPSARDLAATTTGNDNIIFLATTILLFMLSRVFYDCLVYWTGAGPAEHRSVTRRPLYKEYQKITNVLVPISIPFLDHHRTPGWPDVKEK